jgi:hypothetical protein
MEKSDINIVEVVDKSWELTYDEYDSESDKSYQAQCKFELSSDEDAVIHHLEVPEEISNQGIGTKMVEIAEQIITNRTDAQYMYAQIGTRNGATKHILSNKFGYNIIGTFHRDTLGEVVDAEKKIR